ncbi:CHC2 zinc finger domain-containing protein, partial [Aquimarina agarivorans]|uniref:CHC2 zinc finger domain-containing protein n=1 Tax=Aquimarina agarivorans TaxID=980584 RepID=UPI001EE6890C
MVLQHYGLEIKNNHVHCPFHADKTPSMRVYTDTNMVFCFSGKCDHGNKVIDVIDFVMLKESCSKHQAILKCKELLGVTTTQTTSEIFHLLKAQLKRSKKALHYLESRGLKDLNEVGSNHRNGGNQVAYLLPHLKNCVVFPLKNAENEIVSLYGRSFSSTVKGCHYYLTDRKG